MESKLINGDSLEVASESSTVDVSKDDSLTCYKTRHKKIGIVYHGAKSKLWSTKE